MILQMAVKWKLICQKLFQLWILKWLSNVSSWINNCSNCSLRKSCQMKAPGSIIIPTVILKKAVKWKNSSCFVTDFYSDFPQERVKREKRTPPSFNILPFQFNDQYRITKIQLPSFTSLKEMALLLCASLSSQILSFYSAVSGEHEIPFQKFCGRKGKRLYK